jgi:3-dehydroquinate synthetase
MAAAARLSASVGLLAPEEEQRLLRLLRRLYPDWPGGMDRDRVLSHLAHDKKRDHRGQTWILLKQLGSVLISHQVPRDRVEQAVESILYGGKQ